jgi:hypothetical protein
MEMKSILRYARPNSRWQSRTLKRVRQSLRVPETLETRAFLAGDLAITEFMADNQSTIRDEDGAASDWIELQNVGDAPINTFGWHLTNEASNPTKWTLPARTLAPGEHLVVFASGKDQVPSAGSLHTNFTLASTADDLQLYHPDGTTLANGVVNYPHQPPDVSYGVAPQTVTATWIDASTPAHVLVPGSAAELAPDWKQPNYDDSAWLSAVGGATGPQGVGYEVAITSSYADVILADAPVRYYRFEDSSATGQAVDTTGTSNGTFRGNMQLSSSSAYEGLGQAASFDGSAGTHIELPVFHPGASVTVEAWVKMSSSAPTSGFAAIVARWDGSYELDVNIGTGKANFVTKNSADTFSLAESSSSFTREQWHHVVGVFADGLTTIYVNGQQGTVADASDTGLSLNNAGSTLFIGATRDGSFRWTGLIDEVAIYDRALTVDEIIAHRDAAQGAAGLTLRPAIATDLQTQMYQRNASAAIRLPFSVTQLDRTDQLTFRTRFDDGFVAYLNGTEIARHNASPGTPAWNATATGTHPNANALQFVEWDITDATQSLIAGENVLAIHGLNVSATDRDFLISAEILATQQGVLDAKLPLQYLDSPTPGSLNTAGSAGVHSVDGVLINEVAARNNSLLDEDGDTPDWIELYNPHPYAVDLDNAYLTDNPNDLTKWRFTRGSIVPPRGYLLVFASNKDRTEGELHTNFKLASEQGFLALVDPDRQQVISEYRPLPQQFSGASYGHINRIVDTTLIAADAEATVLIPKQPGDIPSDWTSPSFNDSTWHTSASGTSGPMPVGFGLAALPGPGPDPLTIDADLDFSDSLVLVETGHRIPYEANPNGGTAATVGLTNLALAAGGATPFATSTLSVSSFGPNRLNDGAYGEGPIGGGANPWIASSSDNNGFVGIRFASPQSINMMALGTRLASRGDGVFTIEVTKSDFTGVSLTNRTQLEALGWTSVGSITSSEPNEWERQLIGFSTQSEVTGIRIRFQDPGTAISEIETYYTPVESTLGTDLAPMMATQASTALIRIPFAVEDITAVDQLLLNVQYDDGFVAYLNGVEIARRNAPDSFGFDAVATSEHSFNVPEQINVSQAIGTLRTGPANVLAIHGFNTSAADEDFAVRAELRAQTVSTLTDPPRYFLTPTPGSANGTGSEDQGPVISEVQHGPTASPGPADDLVITARVHESGDAIGTVDLHYRVMFNPETTVAMKDDGMGADSFAGDGIYTGVIPASAYEAGQMVRYYVTSFDNNSHGTRWPLQYDNEGQDQAPVYLGTVVADPSVTSQLPRVQWFVPTAVPVTDGITEWSSRASVYFDGEFYDNIFVRIRGASSRNEEKKPFKFDFADGHYFRYSDDAPRAEEINLNATFQDKAYLREPLAYETIARAGVPSPDSMSVRVELNGQFFSVASLTQQIDDIFLAQNGLDPEGALYKMYNGITSAGSGIEKKTRLDEGNNDLAALVAGLSPGNPNRKQYVFDNIDLPAAINYMVSGIIVQDFDRGAKNFYVYRDTNGSGEWTQIPWDEDLTFGNRFYSDDIAGDGSAGHGMRSHPFWGESAHNLFGTNMMIDAIVDIPETREMYLRRLRTLMDDILQSPDTPVEERWLETRIDQLSAVLADDAATDLAKWGAIYGVARDFQTAIGLIRTNYLDQRRVHLFETHNIANLEGGTGIVSTLIPEFASNAQYFVPQDNSLGLSWTGIAPPTNAGAWNSGQTGIGYETQVADYAGLIRTAVNPIETCATCTTVMVRLPFNIPNQAALNSIATNGLTLRMKYDDGFVAYLNGQEVARRGITGTVNFDSVATNHDDTAAVVFEEINISSFASQLNVGQNMLAIQVVNQAATSSDLLILPMLVEGLLLPSSDDIAGIPNAQPSDIRVVFDLADYETSPASGNQDEEYIRLNNPNNTAVDISGWQLAGGIRHTFKPGTVIPAGGSLYVSPNVVAFRARTSGPSGGQSLQVQGPYSGNLSSFGETVQLVKPGGEIVDTLITSEQASDVQRYLRVSELHYNPAGSTAVEFIELINTSSGPQATALDLSGVTWVDGPSETFVIPAGTILQPGQYVVIVQDTTAFRAAYPLVPTAAILGQYAGSLSNGGERIHWNDAAGNTIVDFEYQDGGLWTRRADGVGASLELVDLRVETSQLDEFHSWQGSSVFGGTPAATNSTPIGVVINEVLASTGGIPGVYDSIELLNTTSAPINLSGWMLSDSAGTLLKYAIPAGTILGAGEYLVVDERQFNPTPSNPEPRDFALSGSRGDDVWLVVPNGHGGIASFVDEIEFDASMAGVSFGRTPNGSGMIIPQSRVTLGCHNRFAAASELVISEIQYNPSLPSSAALAIDPALTRDHLEFVELHNGSSTSIDLGDWRVRGDTDVDFLPGTIVAPGETVILVSFSPTNADRVRAFRAHYGIGEEVRMIGQYGGQLNNGSHRLRLQHATSPAADDPQVIPWIIADEVTYDDRGEWSTEADGTGNSLTRRSVTAHGNDGTRWSAAAPTPGSLAATLSTPGDFDGDGLITGADIDQLFDALAISSNVAAFDLDSNGTLDRLDAAYLITELLETLPGDANLDGVVDGLDFNVWSSHKFSSCSATWTTGDFNGDASVDVRDFNVWHSHRFSSPDAAASEPSVRTPRGALPYNTAMSSPISRVLWKQYQSDRNRRNASPSNHDNLIDQALAALSAHIV